MKVSLDTLMKTAFDTKQELYVGLVADTCYSACKCNGFDFFSGFQVRISEVFVLFMK